MTNRRPSLALVISLLALFISVSGVAYAAATVGTANIKNGAVTEPKLAPSAVTSSRLADGTVRARDVGTILERSKSEYLWSGDYGRVTAECPKGSKVIGGGHSASSEYAFNSDSEPYLGESWTAVFYNDSDHGVSITAEVLCLT